MSPAHQAQLLGEVIVGRGLMSDEQLQDALLEQRVSRKRLGAILVSTGVISPPDLTAALLAQLGHGTGAGNTPQADVSEPAEGSEEHEGSRRKGLFRRRRAVGDSPAQNGGVPVTQRIEEPPATLADATLGLLRDFEAIAQSHLSELRREFEEAGEELETARIEILARNERIAELETLLQTSDRERRQVAGALRDEIALTEAKLRAYRTAEPAAGQQSEPSLAHPPERAESPGPGYLLLVPDALGGHALQECPGEPPPVGGQIEVGGHRFLVVSHRRSPMGSDERLCVQLQIG